VAAIASLADKIARLEAKARSPMVLALTLAMTGPSLGRTLTCETSGDRRHCFDRGYLSTEEWSRP
jgi:hypothetical protein